MGPEELQRQAELEDRHFWYAARRRQVLRRLPAATSGNSWALDLGAGSGGNTPLLRDKGYRAIALEHHPVAAGFARTRGLDVLRADAHRLPFADESFAVVLACDVLEHLQDDQQAVREIRRVLQPGGLLVATVPADPRLWSAHDVALQHMRRYTRESLTQVLTEQGLVVHTLSAWMVLLRPVVALRRRRHLNEPTTDTDELDSDLEPVAAPLNLALGLVLRLEHHLPFLGRSRRGVSLVAVASKSA